MGKYEKYFFLFFIFYLLELSNLISVADLRGERQANHHLRVTLHKRKTLQPNGIHDERHIATSDFLRFPDAPSL